VIALPVDQIDRIDPAAAAESVISYLSPSSSRRPSMVPVPVVPARRPSVPARRPSVAPESTGLHSQPIPDTDPDTVSRHVHDTNTNTNTNPSSDLALQPEAAPKPSHSPSTLDMDIDVSLLHAQKSLASASAGDRRKAVGRIVSRTAITAACTAAAVGIPDFGKVMAFLGSFSAFLICVILPVSGEGWSGVISTAGAGARDRDREPVCLTPLAPLAPHRIAWRRIALRHIGLLVGRPSQSLGG
jgi:hypothetical protein